MTKISNQRAYIPDEEINGLDYLPGTDFDQALKTVNFRVQDLGTHYNQVNGVRNFDYNFYAHSGSNPKPADGYFYSNSNEQDPNNITYFVFSKKTARFKDTTNFFESISTENPFDLIIAQKVDINTIFFFRIDSIETFSGYYKLNVSEVFFPNGKELSYTLSYAVFNLKSEGGPTVTKTSDLINDGSDGTSTYVETDELGAVAFSNDYNDLGNKPTIPTVITNHSGLSLDDGTNPHGTTKGDIGLGNVPNIDTSTTSNISEGSNLYFTTDRVLATILSGLSLATGGAIVSADSILVAFGKIQKQIDDLTTSIGNKLNKVTTAGVERAYIINADGSQSTKATSDFKDVLEYANLASFPVTGETGKIYLALDTNSTYRWSGSAYVQIGGINQDLYPIKYWYQATGVGILQTYGTNAIFASGTQSDVILVVSYRKYLTTTALGNLAIVRESSFNRINGALGFHYEMRFKLENTASAPDWRGLFGFRTTGAPSNINPTDDIHPLLGIGADSGDTNLFFISKLVYGTIVKVDTGIPKSTTNELHLEIKRLNGTNTNELTLKNLSTGDTVTTVFDNGGITTITNYVSNNTSAKAIGFSIQRIRLNISE